MHRSFRRTDHGEQRHYKDRDTKKKDMYHTALSNKQREAWSPAEHVHQTCNPTAQVIKGELVNVHKLSSNWDIYCHIPANTDWSLNGYTLIKKSISCIEEGIELVNIIPDALLCQTMFFVMRTGITPLWEDEKNRSGGSFSFKLLMRQAPEIWNRTFFALIGGFICKDAKHEVLVTGISLSPKRNFCILKIWMKDCKHQDVDIISDIQGLLKQRSLFRPHVV
jgi:hypothetical protein